MAAVGGDVGDSDAVELAHRGWVTLGVMFVLSATGLALSAVPVVVARNIYGYYTREYVPSFGTPIGVPFEFWSAEVAGVLGAVLLLTAALRGRGRLGLGQQPLAPRHVKPVSWGRVSVMTAATLCVGLLSLFAPFAGGDRSFIEGPRNEYARNLGLYLIGLTLLADLLLVGWVIPVVRAVGRVPLGRADG